MAELLNLAVEKRGNFGKGAGRTLRAEGIVPGVYYDAKGQNIPVQMNAKKLGKLYHNVGKTQVFNLDIEDNGSSQTMPSLIWAVQRHPYKDQYLHIDFFGVDLETKVKVMVPLEVQGEAVGVKTEGGMLELYRDHIEVFALPMDIPASLVVDITDMHINDHLSIEELQLPDGVEVSFDENFAIVGIIAKSDAAEDEEGEEMEAGAEAEAEDSGEAEE